MNDQRTTEVERLARADLWQQAGYRSQGYDCVPTLRLNCNENPWAPDGASDPLINRYPEKQPGELVLRLAELYGVHPGSLLITRGADDGIDALIRSFCLPGKDSISQCSPAFVMYEFFAKLQSVQVRDVPLDASNGFAVDFDRLKFDKRSKIFFLCAPNNPTGTLIDSESIIDFAESVKRQALVVVDEAYIEFADCGSLAEASIGLPNLVVLRTLSKAWSLAGARLGVIIANGDLIGYLQATTSPYPLSRSAVKAALQATDSSNIAVAGQRIELLKVLRERLAGELNDLPFVQRVFPSQANFLLVRVPDSSKFMNYMMQHGVLLRDQSAQPGLENCVRITVGTEHELDQLLKTMNAFQETN